MKLSYEHLYLPGTDQDAPPLLLLHGTGGDERDLLPLAQSLSPGSAVLSPRGDVNEHGQLRFFRRFAEGVFDLDDVRRRTLALGEFVSTATRHYGIDASRLIALGFSNGANIAATLLQLRPEVLAGGVLLRAMVVLNEPAQPGSLRGKRILLSNGTADPIVPNDHPVRLAELLRAGGAEVTLRQHPGSHGLVSADVTSARDWLRALQPT